MSFKTRHSPQFVTLDQYVTLDIVHVLDRSLLLTNLLRSNGSNISFEVNGHTYDMYHLLADSIYP